MAGQKPFWAQRYIGCKVNLLSQSDVRYEGTVIDLNEESVSLGEARSFGTEDRLANQVIPPCNEVYQIVVFKRSNIKEIFVPGGPLSLPPPRRSALFVISRNAGKRWMDFVRWQSISTARDPHAKAKTNIMLAVMIFAVYGIPLCQAFAGFVRKRRG
ncbi:protein LSM14 homolog car-1-like [Paramacrobiotus metropolitanus]|uniref:protein LSM14 homolog car-1-like n=1 Tax=Paramacrobiotus metropolitanus TaxID=2943436 RepID=UPI002446382E|nr:protein LSM14 homolog car-1-like [Paramacrobiotus metropolitanus]